MSGLNAPFAHLTVRGYGIVMKAVQMAQLKARLSAYLREVRRGHSLTVFDRNTPITTIVPYANDAVSVTLRHPRPDAPKLRRVPLPPPLKTDIDVVGLLLEERQGEP